MLTINCTITYLTLPLSAPLTNIIYRVQVFCHPYLRLGLDPIYYLSGSGFDIRMIFWHRGGSRQVSDVSYTMGDSVTNISGDPDMMLMEECRECLIFSNRRHYEN